MASGIDVHGNKGFVDWAKVKAAGYSFAWVKATEGRTFNDARFAQNRQNATAAGLHVFGYHFARPDLNSAEDEAAHYIAVVDHIKVGELRPALDFEHPPANTAWALRWLELVEKALGVRPVFYTFPSFLASMPNHAALNNYPLWFASYGPNDGKRHPVSVPAGFRMVAHQFTSNGAVSGVSGSVDLNFAESLDAIIARERITVYQLRKDGKVVVERRKLRRLARWIVRHPRRALGSRLVKASRIV